MTKVRNGLKGLAKAIALVIGYPIVITLGLWIISIFASFLPRIIIL